MDFSIVVDKSEPTPTPENIERPINTYLPPSVDEIIDKWTPDNFPALTTAEADSDPTAYTKNGLHAVIHKSNDGSKYHVNLVISESEGVVYMCSCFTDKEAAGTKLMVDIIHSRNIPLGN